MDDCEDQVIGLWYILVVKSAVLAWRYLAGSGGEVRRVCFFPSQERAIPYHCYFRPILRSFFGRCIAGRRRRRLWSMEGYGGGRGQV